MLKKLLSVILPVDQQARNAQIHRNFVRDCAKMGGTLFGEVPKGGRREFFCLDEHTWVWHEEWTDANGIRQVRTTRYDVRPQGIFKAQDGQPYQPLSDQETERLLYAVNRYNEVLDAELAPYMSAAAA